MSHNVQITGIKINNLDALDKACTELRAEGIDIRLERGTGKRSLKFRTYQSGTIQNDDTADHVIRMPGCEYDIGLVRHARGHYEAVYDNALGLAVACPIACAYDKPGAFAYLRTITDKAELDLAAKGIGMGKLMQRYAATVAEMDAKRRGYLSRRVVADNGTLQVVITTR